jgi:hypothetical protein
VTVSTFAEKVAEFTAAFGDLSLESRKAILNSVYEGYGDLYERAYMQAWLLAESRWEAHRNFLALRAYENAAEWLVEEGRWWAEIVLDWDFGQQRDFDGFPWGIE